MTLTERINEALRRITSGPGVMRIPADECDADMVLVDARNELESMTNGRAEVAAMNKAVGEEMFKREVAERCQAVLAKERDDARQATARALAAGLEHRAKAERLEAVLVSRHGGEPVALLAELDAARAEVERLRTAFELEKRAHEKTWQHKARLIDAAKSVAERQREACAVHMLFSSPAEHVRTTPLVTEGE